MKIADIMSRDVQMVGSRQTLAQAAQIMQRLDIGALPVAESDQLVGMVTDRDIVVRGLASGKNPVETPVGEVMSPQVLYCYDDQEVSEVASNMGQQQVKRIAVVSREKQLVGFVSLGDIAASGAAPEAQGAMSGIAGKA